MGKIRYSQIVGDLFYRIKLTDEVKDMVDTYFTGASHHLRRFEESKSEENRLFHLTRHRIHLRLMMTLIWKFGDFSEARDESSRDLDYRDTWNPDYTIMPDPFMFRRMHPDWRFMVGQPHVADTYVHNEDWLSYFMKEASTVNKS
ncbi:MAG TPA: hypothetical protein VNJ08_08775 [Bacteriovoracaceae bacterium]|nr:hypothetical protein [Bacteriovoracaceae bacterium]